MILITIGADSTSGYLTPFSLLRDLTAVIEQTPGPLLALIVTFLPPGVSLHAAPADVDVTLYLTALLPVPPTTVSATLPPTVTVALPGVSARGA